MRVKLRHLFGTLAAAVFLTSLYYFYRAQVILPFIKGSPQGRANFSNFLVDSDSCSIPNIDPFDQQIESLVWRTGSIKCKGKPAITFQDGDYLRIDRHVVKTYYDNSLKYCDYEPIIRPDNTSDYKITYTNTRHRFHADIRVKHQFMRVYCYSNSDGVIYLNFHAFVLPHPEADERFNKFKHHVTDDSLLETFSIIMVGLDSVSRLNSMRQLVRTRHYLLDELDGIELLGYNKVAENTFVNVVPMTVGKYVEELPWNERMSSQPFDKYNFIWKRFQSNGFLTQYAEDAPNIAIFNYLKAGFHIPPADYYIRPLSLAMERHKSLWNHKENCFGNRLETNIILDWVNDFVNVSGEKPFFSFSFITRLTHNDVNVVGAADEPHLQFIKKLHKSGVLDKSVLFYFSDHGMRFGDIRTTYVGKLEDRLPLMIVVFPRWFYKKYPVLTQNLRNNRHRLSTPFDIHETLVDLLYFNETVGTRKATSKTRGISLFDVIPASRTCSSAGILSHWCSCQKHETVPNDHEIIRRGANIAVDYINEQTSRFRYLCTELALSEIKQSWRSIPSDEVLRFEKSLNDVIDRQVVYGKRTQAVIDYQMFIVTAPNNAVFEVSVRHNEETDNISLVGDIVRISEIGDESVCIGLATLKKLCYCSYV